jgi:cellulase
MSLIPHQFKLLTNHKVYLAKVPDATQQSVTGLKWFKIAEDGLDANGVWGVNRLINNGGKASAVIPKCIPPGNYFLRAEIIGESNIDFFK